jgi:Glycosyltransferase family 87
VKDSPLWCHSSGLYARFISAAAGWLTAKRIKIYSLSLPLVCLAVILIDCLVKGSAWFVYKGDFILFYTGGKYLLGDRLDRLYDFAGQQVFQSETLRLTQAQFTPYNHPPFATLFYAPFAIGSFESGLLFWSAAGIVALWLAWRFLQTEFSAASVSSPLALTALSFCFYPTIAWILANQNSAYTLLIYTVTYVQLRRRQDLAAGATLGLLLYKPQLALTLVFVLFFKRRFRAVTGLLLTAALLIALGWAMSPTAMSDYFRILPQIAELPFLSGYPVEKMHNFYGFSLLLLGNVFSRRVVELAATALMIAGLFIVTMWWRAVAWEPTSRQWNLTMASTLALGLLISPHLMLYDLMALLLPIAIVSVIYGKSHGQRRLDGGPVLVWTALMYAFAFVSTYWTDFMLQATAALGSPKFAVQLSVPIVFAWAVVAHRAAVPCPIDNEDCGAGA